jgi:hypothetical protein
MNADKKFFGWLDGELDGYEAAEMSKRVASDPKLAGLAEQHRAMQARLSSAFATVAAAPVPDEMRKAASPPEAKIIDFGPRLDRRRIPSLFGGFPQWALMAATMVLGLFVGTLLPSRQDSPVELRGGTVYAAGLLGQALDTELASAPSGGPVRIQLTFRNSAGEVCRSFTGSAATGLACRSEGRWHIRGLFPNGQGEAGQYRMAAGMNPVLTDLVDSSMAGAPMDAGEEKAARDHGWR